MDLSTFFQIRYGLQINYNWYNLKESKLKFESRKHRFTNSKRWTTDGLLHKLKQGLFDIEIFEIENEFSLKINGKTSKKIKHKTLTAAKTRVFEIIEDGQLMKFFKDSNYDFDKQKKSSRKKTSR